MGEPGNRRGPKEHGSGSSDVQPKGTPNDQNFAKARFLDAGEADMTSSDRKRFLSSEPGPGRGALCEHPTSQNPFVDSGGENAKNG